MNSLHVIMPYRWHGGWVFDDPAVGLHREPFIAGADTLCEQLSYGQPKFRAIFSARKFPSATTSLNLVGANYNGHLYICAGSEVWLCPALLKYFDHAPRTIWLKVEHFPSPCTVKGINKTKTKTRKAVTHE